MESRAGARMSEQLSMIDAIWLPVRDGNATARSAGAPSAAVHGSNNTWSKNPYCYSPHFYHHTPLDEGWITYFSLRTTLVHSQ